MTEFSYSKHIKETILLAYPVMIGQLGFMMMGVVDSLMVGEIGAAPLAAASLGNSLTMVIFIVSLGVAIAVTPLVAISNGAGNQKECEKYFKQSILVNIIFGLITLTVIVIISYFIQFLDQPQEVVNQASSYTRILGLSIIPVLLFHSYKQFIEGLSFTKPAMYFSILANLVNAFTNWLLIYGNLGFPQLGLDGAGWATLMSRIFMAVGLFIYTNRSINFRNYNMLPVVHSIDFPTIKKILKLGLPSGFQYLFEVGAFSFAVVMVGWIGTKPLAAHQIAINLASISFMIVLGISSAGGIRVGDALGKKDFVNVRTAGITALVLGVSLMTLFGIVFMSLNKYLPTLYIKDNEVILIASSLIIIAAIFQIFDGAQAVGIGILRGLTDVKVPTLITFIAYWIIGLPSAYLFGFVFDFGVSGIWVGLLISLASSASMLTVRFIRKTRQLVDSNSI
ncbi:MAG TPA: MATE family efflux transporter [Ignavibacteriaceae bacterium]|nr:MATE family efflux transporter [Ignavibacteriaceae bacterium]